MTQYELNFSLLVEQMLSRIEHPAYRQMMVEVRGMGGKVIIIFIY